MKLAQAIAYLEDSSNPIQDRFRVLTGWDTINDAKDKCDEYWINALSNKNNNIIKKIESASAQGWGMFSAGFAIATGTDLRTTLHDLYVKGIDKDDEEQIESQESYISTVASYLEKYQENEHLAPFEFEAPDALLSREVRPTAALT